MKKLNKKTLIILFIIAVAFVVLFVNRYAILYKVSPKLYLMKCVEKNFESVLDSKVYNMDFNLKIDELKLDGEDMTDDTKGINFMCDMGMDLKQNKVIADVSVGVGTVQMYTASIGAYKENITFADTYLTKKGVVLPNKYEFDAGKEFEVKRLGKDKGSGFRKLRIDLPKDVVVILFVDNKMNIQTMQISLKVKDYTFELEGKIVPGKENTKLEIDGCRIGGNNFECAFTGQMSLEGADELKKIDESQFIIYNELTQRDKNNFKAQIELKLNVLKLMVPDTAINKLKELIDNFIE
ncbi:MAG: hypothetical protein IKL73_04700 [Lachnospiraceae bacterium]|nr:hypothetical protein [Lachnospiraceae bacterium]